MKKVSKAKRSHINTSPLAFERAFQERLSQTPFEWLRAKIDAGSRIDDIKYLYEISAAEIARRSNCMMQPFGKYYAQYLDYKKAESTKRQSIKVYNKLVRDQIPEIIESSGKTCTYESLPDEQYLIKLDAKLREELAEYQKRKNLEALADLLEVMGAIVKARGYTWDELTAVRKKKREAYGGFEKRIFLKEVTEG